MEIVDLTKNCQQPAAQTPEQHITLPDLNNLLLHQPYHERDVPNADGSPLTISHMGSTLLPSHFRDLVNKIFYVLDIIHRNLILIYRSCNTVQVPCWILPSYSIYNDTSFLDVDF